jgi:hypothetical protein
LTRLRPGSLQETKARVCSCLSFKEMEFKTNSSSKQLSPTQLFSTGSKGQNQGTLLCVFSLRDAQHTHFVFSLQHDPYKFIASVIKLLVFIFWSPFCKD